MRLLSVGVLLLRMLIRGGQRAGWGRTDRGHVYDGCSAIRPGRRWNGDGGYAIAWGGGSGIGCSRFWKRSRNSPNSALLHWLRRRHGTKTSMLTTMTWRKLLLPLLLLPLLLLPLRRTLMGIRVVCVNHGWNVTIWIIGRIVSSSATAGGRRRRTRSGRRYSGRRRRHISRRRNWSTTAYTTGNSTRRNTRRHRGSSRFVRLHLRPRRFRRRGRGIQILQPICQFGLGVAPWEGTQPWGSTDWLWRDDDGRWLLWGGRQGAGRARGSADRYLSSCCLAGVILSVTIGARRVARKH